MKINNRSSKSPNSVLAKHRPDISKQNKERQVQRSVDLALSEQRVHLAYDLVNLIVPETHWALCKKSQILYLLNKIPRSLNALRIAVRFQRKNCVQCLQLLLKIIEESPCLKGFMNDIEILTSFKNLPEQIKKRCQMIRIQIKSRSDSNKKIEELTEYYHQKGLHFQKLQIVQITSQYRVARAKTDIMAHEQIIFVPFQQMITLQMARDLPELRSLVYQQLKLKSPKHTILALFLLIHERKNEESPFFMYIKYLPKKLSTFPFYYSQQLLDQLKGTNFLNIIKKKKSDLQEDFRLLGKFIPQVASLITYQQFVWARMIVCSRIFGIMMNDRKTDALVPIADMLNHKAPKMTSWYYSDRKKGFVVDCEQQIMKGQEIYDSYGSKCNSRFLLNYGFTLADNPSNQIIMYLNKRKGSRLVPPSVKLTMEYNYQQIKKALTFYRKHQIEGSNNNLQGSQLQLKLTKGQNIINNRNQSQVWRQIQKSLQNQIKQYPTSVKSDMKQLSRLSPEDVNMKNIIEIRLGEKKILQFYIKVSQSMIHLLEKQRPTQKLDYQDELKKLFNRREE